VVGKHGLFLGDEGLICGTVSGLFCDGGEEFSGLEWGEGERGKGSWYHGAVFLGVSEAGGTYVLLGKWVEGGKSSIVGEFDKGLEACGAQWQGRSRVVVVGSEK